MNWEELCKNAEIKGYKVERNDKIPDSITIKSNGKYEVSFYSDGSIRCFCGWESIDFADDRTPDQMWIIMKALS